tara:strand:+ start:2461 stop:3753 length:1293 start_codon:yes stop_codon:yes gene_type:complete
MMAKSNGFGILSQAHGAVLSSTIGISVGITSTVMTVFGLFLIPISEEFGWTRSSVAVVLPILAITSALIYPVIGHLADRYGSRIVVLLGSILFAASVALVSQVKGLFQFYAVYTLIGITGSVLGPIIFTKVIAGWFNKNRGFYLGMVSGVGNGVGSTVMPLIVAALMAEYGWRGAYQGIGLIILCLGIPVLYFLLRDPPPLEASEVTPEGESAVGYSFSQARKTKAFWMIILAIPLCAGCMMAVFIHVVPMLLDRGFPVGQATTVLATFALVTVAGQICAGWLLDRLANPRVVAPLFLVAMLGIPLLEFSDSYPVLLLSAAMMGIGLGTEFGLLPYSISRYFGLKSYGAISGVMYSAVAMTTGFLPVLMDVVFDLSGSYQIAMVAITAGMLVGSLLVAFLPPFSAVMKKTSAEKTALHLGDLADEKNIPL